MDTDAGLSRPRPRPVRDILGDATGWPCARPGDPSLPLIRQRAIAARLSREGAVTVAEVATELGVSKATARRDIDAVVLSGVGMKVHGGAVTSPLTR